MSVPAYIADLPKGPDGEPFHWGRIDAVHRIGDFAVVESTRIKPISNVEGGRVGEVNFHSYVFGPKPHTFGDCTNHGHLTLDGALAYCLAYKYDKAGANTRADGYYMRGIGAIR